VHPLFEQQILDDPASDDAYVVYADWLQQQGDVRGELAALQAKLAIEPNAKPVRRAEAQLRWDHRTHFYGAFAPYLSKQAVLGERRHDDREPIEATWRHGWIDSLVLSATHRRSATHRSPGQDEHAPERVEEIAELLRRIPKVASAKFLRELILERPCARIETAYDTRASGSFVEAVKVLAALELPALRRLTIGRADGGNSERFFPDLGSAGSLWPALGKLEYLNLRVGQMSLGDLVLPSLRELHLEPGSLDSASLASITAGSWPVLEALSLSFGHREYDAYSYDCALDDLAPILEGGAFPKLVHLGLRKVPWGDQLAALLTRSRIAGQLSSLDLSGSNLIDEDMAVLAAHREAFASLRTLDVSGCALGQEGIRLARALAPEVEASFQADEEELGPDGRFRPVGA
jgi:uncharacterized protein (TIGR02996 family)